MRRYKRLIPYSFGLLTLLIFLFFAKKTNLHHLLGGNKDLHELSSYLSNALPQSFQVPKFVYIAHAGGGLEGKTYLNNWEAIENAIKNGVNFIEIDFHYSKDSTVIARHYFEDRTVAEFLNDKKQGTHITLHALLEWLANQNVMLITDFKVDNIKNLRLISTKYKAVMHRIIPQAYTIPQIIQIKEMGFEKIIYTNYISEYPGSVIEKLAATRCLYAITLPYDGNFKRLKYFNRFAKFQTPVFTNTVNDTQLTHELIESGCRGVYTDRLLRPSMP
jgi:glycerophosphoryl diester phosphodiesterase